MPAASFFPLEITPECPLCGRVPYQKTEAGWVVDFRIVDNGADVIINCGYCFVDSSWKGWRGNKFGDEHDV